MHAEYSQMPAGQEVQNKTTSEGKEGSMEWIVNVAIRIFGRQHQGRREEPGLGERR